MSVPTFTLPAPPDTDRHWSIVTLAELLCVAPAVVDALLTPGADGGTDESPDLHGPRPGHTYRGVADGLPEDLGDCWLTDEAAERIAEALPVGLIARRIVDAGRVARLDGVFDFAAHIVRHAGGGPR